MHVNIKMIDVYKANTVEVFKYFLNFEIIGEFKDKNFRNHHINFRKNII